MPKARKEAKSKSPTGQAISTARPYALVEGFIYKRVREGTSYVMQPWCSAAGLKYPEATIDLLNGREAATTKFGRTRKPATKEKKSNAKA